MRDLFKKAMTTSMIAGAALFVSACGGGEDTAANNMGGNLVEDGLMANDTSGVDAAAGTGNLGMAADVNATGTTTDVNATGTTGATGNATDTGTGNAADTGTGTGTGGANGM
jgi:hypothetical protein